jgi:hypothetical protein
MEIRLRSTAFFATRDMARDARAKKATALSFKPIRMGIRFFHNFFLPRTRHKQQISLCERKPPHLASSAIIAVLKLTKLNSVA